MQTTLDKFYQKSRGPSGLRSKFPHKGPTRKLFDDKLKEEPRDETEITVQSPTVVDYRSKCESEYASSNNLRTIQTKSVEPVPQIDDQLKSELLDQVHVTASSRKVKPEAKSETVSEIFIPDNLSCTPTKSRLAESVPEIDIDSKVEPLPSSSGPADAIPKTPSSRLLGDDSFATPTGSPATPTVLRKDVDSKVEPLPSASKGPADAFPKTPSSRLLGDDGCATPTRSVTQKVLRKDVDSEVEPLPSSSKAPADAFPKTPSSRLLGDDGCATPTRSPATQTVLRKQLRLGEFSRVIRDTKRTLSQKRTIDGSGDRDTSPTDIRRSMNDIYGSPKLRRCDRVEVEITSPVKRGTLKPRRLFDVSIASSPQRSQPRRLFDASIASSPQRNLSYVSPSKLLAAGPIRSPQPSPRKQNLERVDYLLAEGKEALVLPRKYLDLEETFHWIETIMKIRISRKETVTFNTIRNDVRKATGRRFVEEHLGMIKAVYPDAFNLSRQLMKVPMNREKSYELVIEVPDHTKSVEREKRFHDRLIERTKLHHQQFLEQYDPTLKIPVCEVKRWHREFNLNDVPDIEPIPLPKAPSANEVARSAKDVLEKTHAIVSGNKRLERALSTISEEKTAAESQKPCQPPSSPASPALAKKAAARQKSLKGIPQGLLEKVRAKEAAKHAQDMTRTPAAAKEAIMLSRLPEIARILRVLFVKEKKSILPEELVLRVVGQSYKEKMSPKELKEHFELLSKHQPGWINGCKVENQPYIRLSKDADMTRVLGRLQKLIETS